MENINRNCNIEWGILIHQLPRILIDKAKEVLPRCIKHTFHDKLGLRVYFSLEDKCNEVIRKKNIVLDGIMFNIYSMVTCLTVVGIARCTTQETIKFLVEANGMSVFNSYPILNRNDYRIILNVPEVLANFEVDSISVDPDCETESFPVYFFCRVCRREGHKQYQCQQSTEEMRGADGARNRSGGRSSNNSRTSSQKNNVHPSVSGVLNTGGGTTGTQSFGNLSAQVNLSAAYPSTLRMETAAEIVITAHHNTRTGSNNAVFGKPSKPLRRTVKQLDKAQSISKQNYPCKEVVKIINDVHGILPPQRLCKFLNDVYHKQDLIKVASKFTTNIPRLIEQIRSVISQFYHQQSCGSDIAKDQIQLIERLCGRLCERLAKKK